MATDPRKKMLGEPDVLPTATVRPDAPQVGGMSPPPTPLSSFGIGSSAAPRLKPGQAAPDLNPQAAGTRFGNTLRDVRRGVVNDQVAVLNTANRAGAGLANALTYLPRTALGFTRDTGRAALGMDPSPNAGQPLGGLTAPRLTQPYPAAPVNFALTHNDVPVRDPRVATPAAATAATPAGATGGGGASPAATNPNFDPAADNISASNLAAVLRPGFRVPPAAPAAADPAGGTVVEGGRRLPMGAMVNGVPTFSDGTAGIPQTMSPEAMKQLAQERSISRADVGSGANVLASDVTGGRTPSTAEQVATLVRNASVPITGSRPSAEQFAAADRNAIALRDPRSAAGIAARNLDMEAQYGRGGARRGAALALQALTDGTNAAGITAQQGENAQALTAAQGQNALDQVALQGQNALANTALENRGRLQMPRAGQQVTLADGTLGIQDPITGAITRSTLADGTTAKAQVTRDDTATKRTNEIMDQLNKGVQEQMKAFLPSKEVPQPTAEMIAQWREQNAKALGLQLGTDPKTGRRVANINGQVVTL